MTINPNGITPVKAIRLRCIDCSGNNHAEVKRCEHEDCPLHMWRFGRKPRHLISDAEREKAKKGYAALKKHV